MIAYKDTLGLHVGDSLKVLKSLPSAYVDCCITSPPYFRLRDYGTEGQIGQEATPEEYIEKLVLVFREVKRVLKDNGTLWINIGDSYNGSGNGSTSNLDGNWLRKTKNTNSLHSTNNRPTRLNNLKPKDLIGIPWMLAFALRSDGWYLRQDIIWSKTNGMPESVQDRCTNSHEYIFLLSKSSKYYFDNESIKQQCVQSDKLKRNRHRLNQVPGRTKMKGLIRNDYLKKNKRSVWSVPVASYKGSHYAVFPPDLIVDCIKAGSPIEGIVLDPFIGSGTTAEVCEKLNRKWVGIDIDHRNKKLLKERIMQQSLFFHR